MSNRFPKYAAGDRIGPWTVTRHLEGGSSGEVYVIHAADDPAQRPCVLKLWHGRCLLSTREEFEEERRIAAHRPGGTRTVRRVDTSDTADADGLPFYTMELLDPLDIPQTFAAVKVLLVEVVECVVALHANGHLHRDINEKHFGRAADGTVRLLDWGCVTPLATAGGDGKIVGTPDYIAPEVHTRLAYSVRSDIYMLGCTLPHFCPPRFRSSFNDVFDRAQSFKPEKRPETATELRNEILACKRRHDWLTVAKRIATAIGILGLSASVYVAFSFLDFTSRRNNIRQTDKAIWDAIAAEKLAHTYYEKKDFANAVRLYERVVVTPGYENAEAYGILAECYLRYQGVGQNLAKSLHYAKLAAERGDARGKTVLRILSECEAPGPD